MLNRTFSWLPLLALVLLPQSAVLASEPFRYPEAVHGRGELKYISGIPVVIVQGAPAEMGEQLGALAFKPAKPLTDIADDFIEDRGWQQAYSFVLKTGRVRLPFFPAHHVEELTAAAAASGWPRDLLIFANTIFDVRRVVQCSAFLVEPQRSATGGPLFGRNLDWPAFGPLHEFSFVTIYRPTGKRSFAAVTFPGLLGCSSGMNDAGLAVALLDASSTKDESPAFNPFGTPTHLAIRRVLEECATVDEAVKLLRSQERAASTNVAMCDTQRSVVLEVTPKSVVVRPPEDDVCICTNHFRTAELSEFTQCRRYDTLKDSATLEQYRISDIAQRMHAVNLGENTMQTMVFEPASLKLHVALGKGPATRLPLQTLDLSELFKTNADVP
jgi:isopenicillin-N N-acyltransferase like protein